MTTSTTLDTSTTSSPTSHPCVLPTPASTRTYKRPRKRILTKEDLDAFQASLTYEKIMWYIESFNSAVVGVKLSDECVEGEGIRAVLSVLDEVEKLVRDTPAVDNKGSRFGNPAFRTFYDRLVENLNILHVRVPGLPVQAISEVSVYFRESWGNRDRIDYGSGMEFNFLCWLICLDSLGVFEQSKEHRKALVLRVFWRYIQIMRILQSTYWLEPAGSHGVWGLDDYHFLPFLFGSAQLKTHKYIRPKSIHDRDVVEEYAKEYMYLACIQFINSIKTASLRWHSPMLDDISGVKTWDKVNVGMKKMYCAEVLGKLPVAQHFLFGSILPYPSSHSHDSEEEENGEIVDDVDDVDRGHVHGEVGWGDCCGIPLPSAFGAAAAAAATKEGPIWLSGPGVRPVPFDV